MKSINFPDMFKSTSTKIATDSAAILSDLRLLLLSDKMTFFGDPYFGTDIQRLFFEQNNVTLKDQIIDTIYVAIQVSIPQITVKRKNIEVTQEDYKVFVSITCINNVNFKSETYKINLLNLEEV